MSLPVEKTTARSKAMALDVSLLPRRKDGYVLQSEAGRT